VLHFTFGIPRGNDGAAGENGATGDVSQAELEGAIAGANSNNGVATLDDPDPDNETLRLKLNELILNGRR
jgi:hypothetical protein